MCFGEDRSCSRVFEEVLMIYVKGGLKSVERFEVGTFMEDSDIGDALGCPSREINVRGEGVKSFQWYMLEQV